MLRIQLEKGRAVLQADARAGHHEAGPHAHVQAVDETAGVAGAVDRGQVYRIRAAQGIAVRYVPGGLRQGNAAAPALQIRWGQQVGGWACVALGIAYVLLGVGESQAHAFNHDVYGVRFRHGRQIETLRQPDRDQRGQALAVGRAFVQQATAIGLGEAVFPGAAVLRHVLGRDPAPVPLHVRGQARGEVSCVNERGPVGGESAQRSAHFRQRHDLAGPRGPTAQQQFVPAGLGRPGVPIGRGPIRGTEEFADLRLPAHGDPFRNGIAFFGVGDGRAQCVGQRHRAVTGQQVVPTSGRAGNADGMARELGHAGIAQGAQVSAGRAGRRAARTVQGADGGGRGIEKQGEAVPAHAGGSRFDDGQHRGCRHGGVRGVAALFQNVQARLGGQGLAGGDHALQGARVAAPRPKMRRGFHVRNRPEANII